MIDEYIRLSELDVWQNQQQFFEHNGISAWQTVPYYVTSNPLIARSYANVIIGYLRDCMSSENDPFINVKLPLYIVELGAGTGRFSFYFLRYLFDSVNIPILNKFKIIYVITDMVEQNIAHCRDQKVFEKYINSGILDFAIYDVVNSKEIYLINQHQIINQNRMSNPFIFIANYIFDGMRNDLFQIKDNRLHATHIAVNHNDASLNDKFCFEAYFNHNQLSTKSVSIDKYYYKNESWNKLLVLYEDKIDNSEFLFPVDALTTLANIIEISQSRFLLLSADRGDSALQASVSNRLSNIAVHGSFSMDVNFYILEQFILLNKGLVKQIKRYENGLNLAMFIVDPLDRQFPEALQCYNDWLAHFNSYDFLKIKKLLERIGNFTTIEEIIAIFQLSHWDQKIFAILLEQLNIQITQLTYYQQCSLQKELEKLIFWFYPSEEDNELLEELKTLNSKLLIEVA